MCGSMHSLSRLLVPTAYPNLLRVDRCCSHSIPKNWMGSGGRDSTASPGIRIFYSLPELMDFKLFGKTILVVNKKFGLFLASQLGK